MQRTTNTLDLLKTVQWRSLLMLLSIGCGGILTVPIHPIAVQAQQPTNSQEISIQSDTQVANPEQTVVTARGNVRLRYPARQLQAKANFARYDIKQKRILLTGHVSIVHQGHVLESESTIYSIDGDKFISSPHRN
jgi:lipopolysaccharide export system protein LptA